MRELPFLDPISRASLLVVAMLALGGATCAPYQRVGVETTPPGADVYVDGELVGQTPLELRVGTEIDHSVMIKKEGYRSELLVLNRNQPADQLDFLTPADFDVRLVPTTGALGRDLEVEVDEAPAP